MEDILCNGRQCVKGRTPRRWKKRNDGSHMVGWSSVPVNRALEFKTSGADSGFGSGNDRLRHNGSKRARGERSPQTVKMGYLPGH